MMLEKTRSRPKQRRPRRMVDKAHIAYVASLPCCVSGCGRTSTVHHLRCLGSDACAGRRSSDLFAVPLCPEHHQGDTGVHKLGEAAFWKSHGIDPLMLAVKLCLESSEGEMP